MKRILTLLFIAMGSLAFSAQLQWGAYYSPVATGTVYLVQASQAVTTQTIADALKSGIPETIPAGYTTWDHSSIITNNGVSYATGNATGLEGLTSGNNMFFVVVSDDITKFAVSEILTATSGDGGSTYLCNYIPTNSEAWTNGDIGGSPDVPEPTALALLALGVAGLALKRRVA